MSRDEFLGRNAEERGISRRDFVKYCGLIAATLGFPVTMAEKVADAMTAARPSVIWLAFSECTGCAESFIRTTYPSIGDLILDVISLDYSETIMAAAGYQSEELLMDTAEKNNGKFYCIIDGSLPTKEGYGMIAGRPMIDIAREVTSKAAATICVGTCSSFGGLPAARPNPSGAKSIQESLGIKTINIPGCPPNAINMVATVVHAVVLGSLPALDDLSRPLFAYGQTIHDRCQRRAAYEAGYFAKEFGDEGHLSGYCLYELGCRGPETYNNCPSVKFNQGISWPIQAGHPCIGCSEPDFWDKMTPFYVAK